MSQRPDLNVCMSLCLRCIVRLVDIVLRTSTWEPEHGHQPENASDKHEQVDPKQTVCERVLELLQHSRRQDAMQIRLQQNICRRGTLRKPPLHRSELRDDGREARRHLRI